MLGDRDNSTNTGAAALAIVPFGAEIKGAKTASKIVAPTAKKAAARAAATNTASAAKQRMVPEGVSESSKTARVNRINKAGERQKQQYEYMKDRYGELPDDAVGNRLEDFIKSGDSRSQYPITKDIDIPDYELDAVHRRIGN